jgi:hypothetical protein
MAKYKPEFNLKYWNLYGLKPDIKDPTGKFQFVSIPRTLSSDEPWKPPAELGEVNRIATLFNIGLNRSTLLLLRKSDRLLQGLDPGSGYGTRLLEWDKKSSMEMTVSDDHLYLLNQMEKKIECYQELRGKLNSLGQWPVNHKGININSQIAVSQAGRRRVAYVGPVNGKNFLVIPLTEAGEAQELEVTIPSSVSSLGQEVRICVDERKQSLVVADKYHHRVLEIDCATGQATIICGTGRPGKSAQGEIASRAPLKLPGAVQVYRQVDMIDIVFIHPESRSILSYDQMKVRPRVILVADSGNLSVKVIAELPMIAAESLELPSDPLLYTLIGSGNSPGGGLPKPQGQYKENLPMYPITEPYDMALTSEGELLIACKLVNSIIFLRPATALCEASVQAKPSLKNNELS